MGLTGQMSLQPVWRPAFCGQKTLRLVQNTYFSVDWMLTASELLLAKLRKKCLSPYTFIHVLMPLNPHTSPRDIKPDIVQTRLITEPKAVCTCPSEESFMADFITDLGARTGCESSAQISYPYFPFLPFCRPSLFVKCSHFILCL